MVGSFEVQIFQSSFHRSIFSAEAPKDVIGRNCPARLSFQLPVQLFLRLLGATGLEAAGPLPTDLVLQSIMPLLFPTQGTLSDTFSSKLPFGHAERLPPETTVSPGTSPSDRYSAWSPAEDLKNKAGALSQEAAAELKRSSQAIHARTGQIELHSAKYYATCTLGGLLACVGLRPGHHSGTSLTTE